MASSDEEVEMLSLDFKKGRDKVTGGLISCGVAAEKALAMKACDVSFGGLGSWGGGFSEC